MRDITHFCVLFHNLKYEIEVPGRFDAARMVQDTAKQAHSVGPFADGGNILKKEMER